MVRYDTNLAAEFHVLSCLHRLGLTANLTLGNKKGVDIVVLRDAGDAVTVEVKGVAKKYDWPVGNLETEHPDQHFLALVSFEGLIDEADMPHRPAYGFSRSQAWSNSSATTAPARTSQGQPSMPAAVSSRTPGS